MVKRFWTITQSDEIREVCSTYDIPKDVENEIIRVIHILDENYGVGRCFEADGGYVALVLDVKASQIHAEYEKLVKKYCLDREAVEFSDTIFDRDRVKWQSDLYIVSNDYSVVIVYSVNGERE